MTAAVVSDVLPGEAIAAAYNADGWDTTPAKALRALAEQVEELEPLGAELLRLKADELEREVCPDE